MDDDRSDILSPAIHMRAAAMRRRRSTAVDRCSEPTPATPADRAVQSSTDAINAIVIALSGCSRLNRSAMHLIQKLGPARSHIE
jgi:hypothetical protein